MNILPKKRWHVRTKENIARVRKDEAEAAEKEKEEQLRIGNANREARLQLLKNKSQKRLNELDIDIVKPGEFSSPPEHINLFEDLEHATTTTNKEHDKELKEKKEEYEKKVGYLTYLGQDTNEVLGKKNWYEVIPQSSRFSRSADVKDTYDKLVLRDKDGIPKKRAIDEKDGEIDYKLKQHHDPIKNFKQFCEGKLTTTVQQRKCKADLNTTLSVKMKASKKKSRHQRDKDKKLQKLREARLKREQQEKQKTEVFLTQLNGQTDSSNDEKVNRIIPKYNSQFNPELARQNYK